MNSNWKDFLLAENAKFANDTDIVFPVSGRQADTHIYPIAHLGILTIAGNDAAKFLQGQITCNINDVSDIKSSLGAICNPKGRAITSFLLVKNADAYLMVLPQELLAAVKKKLQMYVLRSAVTITDSTDQFCLIGLSLGAAHFNETPDLATSRQDNIVVKLHNRSLIIAEPDKAQQFWSERLQQGALPGDSAAWRYLDIMAGIPWLTEATSEQFIPQMLNLDKLGGISFNKGCYTGQEIVARTHYLGKAKRAMFVAECGATLAPEANSTIIDDGADSEQGTGKVLCAQRWQNSCAMLIVLQVSDSNTYNLRLKDDNQDKIALLSV